jgi:nitrogen fixation/metabolism regulation signal transduction histidine kinase
LGLTIENARLQQEVTEKQRVENWKEVTGSIAHTMGTLLFEVKGDIWELRSRLTAANEDLRAAPLEALFDEVNNDISLAEKVLFDFRTFASPPQLKLERIDLRRIVEEVFQPIHGDYLVDMSLLDELPVLVDSFKLSNALREIRKNAQEAMLGVTREQKVMKVKASATRASDTLEAYAQLEITDNGPGLSEEILPRLFKPYVTTKSNGTGLGLAIAKEIIAAHRGSIEATNSPAGGATFVVRIPMIVNLESATRGASDG